ncbi:MAG: O-antigen ligase family protein [Clostridiales bacterium]|nr:O-antigen ligase family protein [Clostridiales bacterium]
MTLVQICCLLFFGCSKLRKGRVLILDLALVLFYGALLIPTVLVSKDFGSWITYTIQGLSAAFLVEEMLNEDFWGGLHLLRNVSFCFILLNLATMAIFRSGLNSSGYFILGSRIGFTPFVLLAVMSAVACEYTTASSKTSFFTVCCFLVGLLNLLIPMVGTGLLTLALLVLLLFYERLGNYKEKRLLNYWVLLGTVAAVTVIVLFQSELKFLDPLFSLVGKDSSFDGRDVIWSCAKYYISRRPLLGYGVTPTGAFLIFTYVNQRMLPAHNEILNLLYQGGALSGLVFTGLFVIVGRAVARCKEKRTAHICAIFICCFCVLMITEIQTQKAILFMVLAMVYQMALGGDHA